MLLGADDGTRTRDPHLGKVICSNAGAYDFVDLSILREFFVVRVPRIFVPNAPRMCARRCRNPHLGEVMLWSS